MTIPTCAITGRIAGDADACGDCDPCCADHAVPDVVKRLLAEKEEWRQKYGDAMAECDAAKAEIARLRRDIGFVARWCYRKGLIGDHARLSAITHHPAIRAAWANGGANEHKARSLT